MDDNDITQEIPIETLDTFDAIIARVRNYLAYGMDDASIGEKFVQEGFAPHEVYLTIQAAKLL